MALPRDTGESIHTVAEALGRYHTAPQLKKLARLLSIDPVPTRKPDIVSAILPHLQGRELRALWERLDDLQKAAVSEVVHSKNSYLRSQRFEAKYGEKPDWGSLSEYEKQPPSPLRFFLYGSGVMPDDLKKRLHAFVPRPPPVRLVTVETVPETFKPSWPSWETKKRKNGEIPVTVRSMEAAAGEDLLAVLRLIDAGKIDTSEKTRRPTAAAMRAIAMALRDGDYYERWPKRGGDKFEEYDAPGPIRSFAWPLLLEAAGLARPSGKRLALTQAGRRALAHPPAGTIRSIWEKWLQSTLLDEFSRIDAVKGQGGRGKHALTAARKRREVVVAALRACPAGKWIATDEFFRFMRAAGFDFGVTRDPWTLYICEPDYGSLGYDGFHDWEILQGRYALSLLFEYASTLGLLDVAFVPPEGARLDYQRLWGADSLPFFSRYDGLLYFRLTSMGAWCIGLTGAPDPNLSQDKPGLDIRPDLTLAFRGAPSAEQKIFLELYAAAVSEMLWRLDEAKLLAAVELGHDPADLRRSLVSWSGRMLPEPVEDFLKDTAAPHRKLRDLGEARLVDCGSSETAQRIARDAKARRHCHPAGPGLLVVPAVEEAAFRQALHALGYCLPPFKERRRSRRGAR